MVSSRSLVSLAALAALASSASPEDAVFTPGVPLVDTRGKRIYAGGANMYTENGVFYLVGEGEKVFADCSECLQLYKSTDLASWAYVGCVLNNSDVVAPQKGQPYYRMERPKIFKCPSTGKHMMWFHCDTPNFSMRSVGVLSAPAVEGPYTFTSPCFRPDGRDSYDMGTFVDGGPGGDGHAYLIRSVENSFAGISQMTDDCTGTTGIVSQGPDMEGQAIMRDAATGALYAMGSHLTGWAPNPMQFVATASATLHNAVWVNNTNPTADSTSFGTQSTFIFPFAHADGHKTYIAMLDRWNMGGPNVLPGGLANMTNVWLPMTPPSAPTPVPPPAAAGWQLTLAACAPGAAPQQFEAAASGSAVMHAASGLCVQGGASGSTLALAACDGSAAQTWALAKDGARVTNGETGARCMSFNNANQLVTAGNPVISWACGSPAAWNELFGIDITPQRPGSFEALDQSGSPSGFCIAATDPNASAAWTIKWRDSWSLKDF